MAITKKSNFTFDNQVRLQHTRAYFRKKLLWSRFAEKVIKNFDATPGNKLEIPYFGKMGAAEKPGEDDRVGVDSLGDSSFEAVVYEVAKAWGITDAARIRMGATNEEWEDEASSQAGRVIAEMVDADALAVLNNDGTANTDGAAGADPIGHDEIDLVPAAITLTSAFTAKKGTDTAAFQLYEWNVREYQKSLTNGFGDRSDEVLYNIIHSRMMTAGLIDEKAGLLKADANSPYDGLKGYVGKLLGKETFMIDNISTAKKVTITDSSSAIQKYWAYKNFLLKANPYGLVLKKEANMESARDMLGRQDLEMITQWYTFVTLHKRIDMDDIRAVGKVYLTDEETT